MAVWVYVKKSIDRSALLNVYQREFNILLLSLKLVDPNFNRLPTPYYGTTVYYLIIYLFDYYYFFTILILN